MQSNGLPAANDIRLLLEGFGFDLTANFTGSATWSMGNPQIIGANTLNLQPYQYVNGTGIPAGAVIISVDVVDPVIGKFTISAPPTAGSTGTLTFTYFSVVSDNWLYQRMANRVIPWVQEKTRQSLTSIQTVTEYYDGTGSSLIILRRKPIVELLSISYTNVDSNLYYLTPNAMQVIADEGILKAKANFNESSYIPIFFRGDRNLRITYTYGFATCPPDIAEAVAMLTADLALEHQASKTGGGNLSVQAFSRDFGPAGRYTTHRKNLAKQAWAILKPYMTGGGS